MNKRTFLKSMSALAAMQWLGGGVLAEDSKTSSQREWSIKMSVLESCNCPVFCPCFFVDGPPETTRMAHGKVVKEKACRFNQAFEVTNGHLGTVRLGGVRFWFAGDAGDFQQPKYEWAVMTFDPSVTKEQRDALATILHYRAWFRPESWKSFTMGTDAAIDLQVTGTGAHATLGNGLIAETKTTTMYRMGGNPVVIRNLGYFGFPRNDGMTLMPADLLAYRGGDEPFEYKGTNGLLVTVDMNSDDVKKA